MTFPAVDPHPQASTGRRTITQVLSLDMLVGAHPDALLEIYRAGRAADPAELGDATRGRILGLAQGKSLFLAARPFIRALASDSLPWKGKVFDHGGNSGQNVVFGKTRFRFRAEVGPSRIDGKPALVLSYAGEAYANPWPVCAIVDELRAVGTGIAIGPAFYEAASAPPKLLGWFGLEAA